MKKVLSVLLAAAMVMGMSVSAFAASWTSGENGTVYTGVNSVVEFSNWAYIVRNGKAVAESTNDFWHDDGKALSLQAGDDIYFPLEWASDADDAAKLHASDLLATIDTFKNCDQADDGDPYTGPIDANWSINILGDDGYVDSAEIYSIPASATTTPWGMSVVPAANTDGSFDGNMVGAKYVKVSIADEFVTTSTTTIEFKFDLYLADGIYESEHVVVEATYGNAANGGTVSYTHTNNAAAIARWTAPAKKGTAVFDFSDKVYFTVDMLASESVILNLSTAYNKNVDALFSNKADMDFYNFKGSKDAFYREGELFIPADEDTFVYEILSDADDKNPELVAVDAEYDDEYTVAGVNKEFEGWVIDTDELGYYVIVDEELVVEEEEVVEAPVVEDNKANPETGANDFVGAAVALAVVSVAAAGALALKK